MAILVEDVHKYQVMTENLWEGGGINKSGISHSNRDYLFFGILVNRLCSYFFNLALVFIDGKLVQ